MKKREFFYVAFVLLFCVCCFLTVVSCTPTASDPPEHATLKRGGEVIPLNVTDASLLASEVSAEIAPEESVPAEVVPAEAVPEEAASEEAAPEEESAINESVEEPIEDPKNEGEQFIKDIFESDESEEQAESSFSNAPYWPLYGTEFVY